METSESKMKEVSHVSDKVSDPQIKRTPSWMKKQEKESEIASETTRQAVPALGEDHKQGNVILSLGLTRSKFGFHIGSHKSLCWNFDLK